MPSITALRDTLTVLQPPPDDGSGRALHERLDELRMFRNVLDHQIAVHVALFDATGAAVRAGSTTRNALIEMGMPPAAAHRYVRIAAGWSRCRRSPTAPPRAICLPSVSTR